MEAAGKPEVVLLGDSTLDNVIWMQDVQMCVPFSLQRKLPDFHVRNFAADGFTSKGVLFGGVPISLAGRRKVGDPFPSPDNPFEPLHQLKLLSAKSEIKHVVLSVGGNDVREILGNMNELPLRLRNFWQNYPAIINQILEIAPNAHITLMLQYRPGFNTDRNHYGVYQAMNTLAMGQSISPVAIINALMEEIYPPIFKLAQEKKFAIIDLSNTFDIYQDNLYSHQIEPSEQGGQLIAELISHVVKSHDFNGGSKMYLKKDGEIKSVETSTDWKVQPAITSPVNVNQFLKTILPKY